MKVVIEALKKLDPRRIFGGNGKPTRAAVENAVAAPDFVLKLSCGEVTVRKLRHGEAEELLADLGKLLPEATGEDNILAALGVMLKSGLGLASVPAKVRDRVITAHTGLTSDDIRNLYADEPYRILNEIYVRHIRENELLQSFFQRGAAILLPHVKALLGEILGPETSTRLFSEPSSGSAAPK